MRSQQPLPTRRRRQSPAESPWTASRGLYESPFDLFDRSSEILDRLERFCVETLVEVVERVEQARLGHHRYTALEVTESWFHVTETGGYHDHHLHAFHHWCGIYYVQTGGDGSAVNRFYQPFLSMDGNRGHYDVAPEPGWLVVFPGHLAHAALPHHGAERRIVISFNTRLVSGQDKPETPCDHLWAPDPAG